MRQTTIKLTVCQTLIGVIGAYNALKDCQNDADAMMVLKETFRSTQT